MKGSVGVERAAHLVTLVPYGLSGVDVLRMQSVFSQDNEIEIEKEREMEREKEREDDEDIRNSQDSSGLCSLDDVILYCTEVYSRSLDCHSTTPSYSLQNSRARSSSGNIPIVEPWSTEGYLTARADTPLLRLPSTSASTSATSFASTSNSPSSPILVRPRSDSAMRSSPISPSVHETLPPHRSRVPVTGPAQLTSISDVHSIVSPDMAACERRQEHMMTYTSPTGVTVDLNSAYQALRQVHSLSSSILLSLFLTCSVLSSNDCCI